MTDRPLSQNLSDYRLAMEQELHVASTGTAEDIANNAREKLAKLLPEATSSLAQILKTGDKDDAVRLSACKMVFEYTLGKPGQMNMKESDTERIIRELMSPPAA